LLRFRKNKNRLKKMTKEPSKWTLNGVARSGPGFNSPSETFFFQIFFFQLFFNLTIYLCKILLRFRKNKNRLKKMTKEPSKWTLSGWSWIS
jgi:ribosomal protein S17E